MIAKHLEEIDKERKKWDYYNIHGTTDGLYPDGIGLNLTRNHIIYHLFEIASIKAKQTGWQLSMFDTCPDDGLDHVDREAIMKDKRIPPEVSNWLMVVDRPLRIPDWEQERLIYREGAKKV